MVGFDNILDHVIPMNAFGRNWRFTDPKYDVLPDHHLDQLKPLDTEAARFLFDYILTSGLHQDQPFKKGFFRRIDHILMGEGNQAEVKKWLYQRGLPFQKQVYLSWDPTDAMLVPWKLFIKYYDSFFYPSSDDLTVFDQGLEWTLLMMHYEVVYFGTNQAYQPVSEFHEKEFD